MPYIPHSGQGHTHEIASSLQVAGQRNFLHTHRVSGMTSEPIVTGTCPNRRHYHEFELRTDFNSHYHTIAGRTTLDIPVGENRHVHFAVGESDTVLCHRHVFLFATHIEDLQIPLTRRACN